MEVEMKQPYYAEINIKRDQAILWLESPGKAENGQTKTDEAEEYKR